MMHPKSTKYAGISLFFEFMPIVNFFRKTFQLLCTIRGHFSFVLGVRFLQNLYPGFIKHNVKRTARRSLRGWGKEILIASIVTKISSWIGELCGGFWKKLFGVEFLWIVLRIRTMEL